MTSPFVHLGFFQMKNKALFSVSPRICPDDANHTPEACRKDIIPSHSSGTTAGAAATGAAAGASAGTGKGGGTPGPLSAILKSPADLGAPPSSVGGLRTGWL